ARSFSISAGDIEGSSRTLGPPGAEWIRKNVNTVISRINTSDSAIRMLAKRIMCSQLLLLGLAGSVLGDLVRPGQRVTVTCRGEVLGCAAERLDFIRIHREDVRLLYQHDFLDSVICLGPDFGVGRRGALVEEFIHFRIAV